MKLSNLSFVLFVQNISRNDGVAGCKVSMTINMKSKIHFISLTKDVNNKYQYCVSCNIYNMEFDIHIKKENKKIVGKANVAL